MNSYEVSRASGKDRNAGQLVVDYYSAGSGSGYKLAPGRFASVCVKCTGANPSYTLAGVPMREIMGPGKWDQLPGVALRNDSFAGIVKLLSRASVGYLENNQKMTLMNGWVIYHGHTITPAEDSVMTAIFDDRHIMGAYFTLFGKMYFDPSTGRHYFVDDPEDPLIFNKGGWGDCIDTPFGPRFAPGRRYGYTSTEDADPSDEPAAGYATTKTRKWTVKDILEYIWAFFYETGLRPPLGQDLGLLELPKAYIKWTKSFGNNIVENKTPRDWNLEGTNCLEAITRTLAYAGPYELSLEPVNDQQSEMKVVKFDLKKNQGANIFSPDFFGNDLNAAMWNSAIAQRVNIKESAAGWIDNVVNMGGAPSVEFMASTDTNDSEAWAGYLVPGWTQAEEDAFKALVSNASLGGEKDTQNAFTLACRKYPSVFCWYRIANTKNPFTGTKWAVMGQSGNWRIKPHLNTSYNSNAASPLGLVPMECIVEYKLYTDGMYVEAPTTDPDIIGRWRWADRYNELQLSPCGHYVQLPALRDRQRNWYTYHDNGSSGNDALQYEGRYMKKRDVRINLVVSSDHALAAKRTGDPNQSQSRIDPGAPKFTLLMRNQPMQYADLLRNVQAYPVGIGGIPFALRSQLTGKFQPKRTAGNEIFTDHLGDGDITNPKNRLLSHADKYLSNYKRIAYEGDFTIARLAPAWQPGMQVSYSGRNVISNVIGMIKCVVFDANAQTTRIEFGPPSYSTLWDGPLKIMDGYGTGGSAPYVPNTPVEKKEDYGSGNQTGSGGESPSGNQTAGGGYPDTSYNTPARPDSSSYNDTDGSRGSSASSLADDYEASSSGKTPGRVEASKAGGAGGGGRSKSSSQILVNNERNDDEIDTVARRELKEGAQAQAGKGNTPGQGDYEAAIELRYGKGADSNSEMSRLGLGAFETDGTKKDVGGDYARKDRGIYKTDDGGTRQMNFTSKARGIYRDQWQEDRVIMDKPKKGITLLGQ